MQVLLLAINDNCQMWLTLVTKSYPPILVYTLGNNLSELVSITAVPVAV